MDQQKKDKIKDYNKLIQLDDKYQLHDQQKRKVTSILQQEVNYLLDKKEKEKEKKKRLKLIQEEYQRKRKLQIQHFQHRNEQSEKTKQHQIQQKLVKNKKKLQYVQKIHKKSHQQYNSIVQKGLQKRKQFYTDEFHKYSKLNSKAQTQQNFKKRSHDKILNQSKLLHSQTSKQMDNSKKKVQNQMKRIQQRLQKAKNNHIQQQKLIMSRMYQKDRHHSQIQQKIRSYSIMQQQKHFKQLYGKNQHIIGAQEKVKDLTQRHLSDRRKSFQQKIKKLHENIKYIESQNIEKFTSLQNKLSKIYETNTMNTMTGNKSRSHRDRVMLNNIKLEEQKKQKAQQILKKHSEITAKNKIYKEKKDQILQVIKKVNPQIIQ